jgi:hypothetical protein
MSQEEKLRNQVRAFASAAVAGAFALSLGALAPPANASDWPPLQSGAYLYSGSNGSGTVTTVDLEDVGNCHTMSQAAVSVQIANGSMALELHAVANCASGTPWRTGTLSQQNLPQGMLSYRVVPA